MASVLVIEPYAARSHAAWLDGLRAHSRHEIDAVTMPAWKWKWRMRGSAVHLAPLLAERRPPDVLLATDFLNLAELVGIGPAWLRDVPTLLYFHENQLTYPLPDESERDYQYAFTHLTSCLAADRVAFNSAYHRDTFLAALDRLLRRMPDYRPLWVVSAIEARSQVLPVGCDLDAIDRARHVRANRAGPLRILWNHRWESDKDPDTFFTTLFDLAAKEMPFEVSVLGESFRESPPIFETARRRLAGRIVQWGFVADRRAYAEALCASDVVVSTAQHEFFGVAVVEAIAAGCFPLLPNRLTYPEVLPAEHHKRHLYADAADLAARLHWCVEHADEVRATDLSSAVRRFGWLAVVGLYDEVFDALTASSRPPT